MQNKDIILNVEQGLGLGEKIQVVSLGWEGEEEEEDGEHEIVYQSSLSWNISLAHQGLDMSGFVEEYSHLIRR